MAGVDGDGWYFVFTVGTNPQVVIPSASDFHLQVSSPTIDAGVNLPQVACDFGGNVRPAPGGPSDTRAYEYGSSPGSRCTTGGGGTTLPPTPTPTPTNQPPIISLTAPPQRSRLLEEGRSYSGRDKTHKAAPHRGDGQAQKTQREEPSGTPHNNPRPTS
jgi:hypothetical protein